MILLPYIEISHSIVYLGKHSFIINIYLWQNIFTYKYMTDYINLHVIEAILIIVLTWIKQTSIKESVLDGGREIEVQSN